MIKRSVVGKRFCWTIFFVFIYVLGSKISLPFVDLSKALNVNESTATGLELTSAVTGGNLRGMSIFSTGLSPWMSSMILWRMFTVSKRFNLEKTSTEIVERRKMYLALALAIVQALAISIYLPLQTNLDSLFVVTINTMIMIAGTFFLVWLSDLNSLFGVGGSLVILMSSMVASMPQNILNSIKELQVGPLFVGLLLIISLAFLYISVIMQRARYRILVNKITIHNRFKRYSYLDIQLNPAGGMPFMYAMSLVSIPQYFLMLLQVIFPNASWIQDWIGRFAIGRPVWLYTYIVVLFILGLAFSFINMNGEEIAEKMKKSGEYIYNIYPGEETSRYINWLILRFAVIGSTYTVLMAGLPMLIVLYDPRYMQLTMLPGLFFIFNGMVFNIKEEIDALTLNENYRPLLEIDS